jgi:aminoethylphosphonate catabolism LysR family transcriptional regulator
MRLTQLRSFHAVAVTGSFTRAAAHLGVSQPTITAQVRLLEEKYGAELFHRRGRGATLTHVGEELLRISQQMFALEGEALQLLQDSGELRTGALKVASVGPHHVTRLLVDFKRRYPQVGVSATTCNSQEVIDRLLSYRADVGILAQYERDGRFSAMPFGRHPIVLFVAPGHRFARRRSVRMAELAGERFVMRERGSVTRRKLEAALAAAGVEVQVEMESTSRELIRECVAAGLGIGAVTRIEFVPGPDVRMVGIADCDLHFDAHVLCLAPRRDSRMVRAVFDLAAERSGGRPETT